MTLKRQLSATSAYCAFVSPPYLLTMSSAATCSASRASSSRSAHFGEKVSLDALRWVMTDLFRDRGCAVEASLLVRRVSRPPGADICAWPEGLPRASAEDERHDHPDEDDAAEDAA